MLTKTGSSKTPSLSVLMGIIFCVVGIGCGSDPDWRRPTPREVLFASVASTFNAPQLCDKISEKAVVGGFEGSGFVRSGCYFTLAPMNMALCDRVKTINRWLFNPKPRYKISKKNCREGDWSGPTLWMPEEGELSAVFVGLGYNDDDYLDMVLAQWDTVSGGHLYEFYKILAGDDTFLKKVEKLPTYHEPLSEAHIRKANPYEYLYQMLAIDRDNAALCEKISPNATYEMKELPPYSSLKLRCLRMVAAYTGDASLCRKLPHSTPQQEERSALVHSRDGCEKAVEKSQSAVQRDVEHNKGYHTSWSGSVLPPDGKEFYQLLRTLGYEYPFNMDQLERYSKEGMENALSFRMTYETRYVELYMWLAKSSNTNERERFVRYVENLPAEVN